MKTLFLLCTFNCFPNPALAFDSFNDRFQQNFKGVLITVSLILYLNNNWAKITKEDIHFEY